MTITVSAKYAGTFWQLEVSFLQTEWHNPMHPVIMYSFPQKLWMLKKRKTDSYLLLRCLVDCHQNRFNLSELASSERGFSQLQSVSKYKRKLPVNETLKNLLIPMVKYLNMDHRQQKSSVLSVWNV